MVQLDFVVLLGIGEVGQRGLILDFLLGDLFFQLGGIELHEHFIGLHVFLGDEIALLNDFQNLRTLITDADFAFDFLGFQGLQAAAFDHGDFQRSAPGGE